MEIENDYVKLDEIDREILKVISEDARTPYRKISRDLDISVGTVHNRIDKLVRTGIVKRFTTVMDHGRLGYDLTAIIGVRIKGGNVDSLEYKTSYDKNIVGIYDVTGKYDAFMIGKFQDTSELDKFIKALLQEPNVERTYTQTVLNVVRENMGSAEML
ncbi:MAG: Lrp/AsnC family transcriptional regulator [Methanobrevibacter sp.]|nr:Lrp/AsnC family transcriptional regulator [Methanobrevibacter sp.]